MKQMIFFTHLNTSYDALNGLRRLKDPYPRDKIKLSSERPKHKSTNKNTPVKATWPSISHETVLLGSYLKLH